MSVVETKNSYIRSSFQAMFRKDMISRQNSLAKQVCDHILKVVLYPDSIDKPHWVDELAAWVEFAYSGVTLKSGSTKPSSDLFSPLQDRYSDVDLNSVTAIKKRLSKTYGPSETSERDIIKGIESFYSLFDSRLVYSLEETKDKITGWSIDPPRFDI